MEANSLLTAEPIEKVRFKRGCRAVYDADGKLLCGIHKKAIYDLNGKMIADYNRTETREEVRKGETVQYEILHYAGENAAFRAENGYLYRGEDRLGRIAPKDKRSAVLAAALVFACVVFAASLLFTSLIGYADESPYPTLTIRDSGGEWGAEADLDIFGEEPIAPGSSGEYVFAIENPTQVRLQYAITIELSRGGESVSFPLVYRATGAACCLWKNFYSRQSLRTCLRSLGSGPPKATTKRIPPSERRAAKSRSPLP